MNKFLEIMFLILASLAYFLIPKLVLAQDSLDAMLKPYLVSHGLPALAVAVTRNGEIVASGVVGTRRTGANIPVTINDKFHIGSDTKAMTALLAAILVEEGKLSWNSTPDEIFTELVSEMDTGFAKITLAQLLSHTSGLPSDNEDIGTVWSQARLQSGNLDVMRLFVVREWSKKPLASIPGKNFEYSNLGYLVAGAMIERVTGRSWDELIFERVFVPLGLTTAGLGCQSSLGKVDAPLGHVLVNGNPQALLAGPNGDNPTILGPAGIAHMSVMDFARWASWNAGEGRRGPALVTSETIRKLHTPVITIPSQNKSQTDSPNRTIKYALGWGVLEIDFANNSLLMHGGSNNLNLSHIWVDTNKDVALVLMTNIAGEKADEALNALARVLYTKYAD